MPRVTYRGARLDGSQTTVLRCPEGQSPTQLDDQFELAELSTEGLRWGYTGPGPQQLALAILTDHTIEGLALITYPAFTEEVIAARQGDVFEITSEEIDAWLEDSGFNALTTTTMQDLLELLTRVKDLEITLEEETCGERLATVREKIQEAEAPLLEALNTIREPGILRQGERP